MPQYRYTLPLHAHVTNPFDRRYSDAFPMKPLEALQDAPVPDLRPYLGPVRDQNIPGFGECADESGAGAVDFLYRRYRDEEFTGSSLFLYEAVRTAMGTPQQDSGSRLRVVQYVLQTLGTCDNALDPDVRQDFLIPITPRMQESALAHRIRAGYWAPTLLEVLNALMAGYVVQIGLRLTASFEDPGGLASGQIAAPQPGDPIVGGHALLSYAPDFGAQRIRTRNSWGVIGSAGGDVDIPFAYFDAPWFLSARVYAL